MTLFFPLSGSWNSGPTLGKYGPKSALDSGSVDILRIKPSDGVSWGREALNIPDDS